MSHVTMNTALGNIQVPQGKLHQVESRCATDYASKNQC